MLSLQLPPLIIEISDSTINPILLIQLLCQLIFYSKYNKLDYSTVCYSLLLLADSATRTTLENAL
ncbi:hypothetical protein THF1D04_140058 [Vibrio owensii]|uniref:Uncharacterized protein n=1 Tax=Vibrio owensii TaxID=696485 RepID=A0AAU9Q1C6_9VIBR|nr:hypothetical protein THF1D04_140058 [Vibrio owensii]